MKKEQIENMIDKKIEKSFTDGLSVSSVMEELSRMSNNLGKTLDKMNLDINRFDGHDFDNIEPIRARYVVHYVRHCERRKGDMVWLVRKKAVLNKTSEQMFKLLKFKEKMTC
jgi:hypothetical protein